MLTHVDNQAAIEQTKGEESAEREKHIAVRLKFIMHYRKKKIIKMDSETYWLFATIPT